MSSSPDPRASDRLTNLELVFTHLERQVSELHKVVVDQQRQIELLEKQIRLLQADGDSDEQFADE